MITRPGAPYALDDLSKRIIEQLQEDVALARGFRIASHKHEIYGTCARCQGAG